MEWVADLKAKIKAFIHGNAMELGLGLGGKSQLLNIFMQASKNPQGNGNDEDLYDRMQ